jgi:hypothetical protein
MATQVTSSCRERVTDSAEEDDHDIARDRGADRVDGRFVEIGQWPGPVSAATEMELQSSVRMSGKLDSAEARRRRAHLSS